MVAAAERKITFNPSQNFGAQSGEESKALVVKMRVKIGFFYAVACAFLFVCRRRVGGVVAAARKTNNGPLHTAQTLHTA